MYIIATNTVINEEYTVYSNILNTEDAPVLLRTAAPIVTVAY